MDAFRGQSETLGFALILSFTLLSVGAIAMFGGSSLQATQQNIGAQNAENAMSQFDSRASMVALGDSTNQRVDLGVGQQGTYTADGDAGWIRVIHENETANTSRTIYNESLGVVKYQGDTTEIAYQGGGVWRKDASSVMLSPPEFRYRGSTLILPVIQLHGNETVSGNPQLTVNDAGSGEQVFPNASESNPVESGEVTVTVKSEYYAAWGRFFETRSDGNVTVDDGNRTASLELVAPAIDGDFQMPLKGESMDLQGIQSHQIDEFGLTIYPDQKDAANFNNLQWSLCAESGSEEFEIELDKGTAKDGESAEAWIYYSPDGTTYQTWTTDAFRYETGWDDDNPDHIRLNVNLTSTANATYPAKNNEKFDSNCGFNPSTFETDPTLEGHDSVGEPRDYTNGDEENVSFLTNHYLALMGPSVSLEVYDKESNTVTEDISTGFIEYNTSEGFYLTYMHISENPVNVTMG